MATGKINVRANGAESGAIGEMNAVVGMTTVDNLKIQLLNNDGTVVVSGNTSLGGSGISVNPRNLFVFTSQASGVGSWPSGDSSILYEWSNKTTKTTIHA